MLLLTAVMGADPTVSVSDPAVDAAENAAAPAADSSGGGGGGDGDGSVGSMGGALGRYRLQPEVVLAPIQVMTIKKVA
jgi:hypothetical protein